MVAEFIASLALIGVASVISELPADDDRHVRLGSPCRARRAG